jgi:hypothetical protein
MKFLLALFLAAFASVAVAAPPAGTVIREGEIIRRLDRKAGSMSEWGVVQLCNGQLWTFRGKRHSVQVPRGLCVVAFGHTHPRNNLDYGRMPSPTDLESAKLHPDVIFYVRGNSGIVTRIIGTDIAVVRPRP